MVFLYIINFKQCKGPFFVKMSSKTNTVFNVAMDDELFSLMQGQVMLNMHGDKRMKRTAYVVIANRMNASGNYEKELTWELMQNRVRYLKKHYHVLCDLLNASGLGTTTPRSEWWQMIKYGPHIWR